VKVFRISRKYWDFLLLVFVHYNRTVGQRNPLFWEFTVYPPIKQLQSNLPTKGLYKTTYYQQQPPFWSENDISIQ